MPTEITTVNFEQHLRLHIDICILVMADENDELTQQHQELIIRIITKHLTEEDFLTSEQDQIKSYNFHHKLLEPLSTVHSNNKRITRKYQRRIKSIVLQ